MDNSKYRFQSFYRRYLPHLHSYDKPIFITWRMAFSLPSAIFQNINNEMIEFRKSKETTNMKVPSFFLLLESKRFAVFDEILAKDKSLPTLLNEITVAEYVVSAIKYYDQIRYNLISFCIMPNHVHLLLIPLSDGKRDRYSLATIMKSIKGYSALKINQYLGKSGSFWQKEYYDHVVRNDIELSRCLNYILNNPVKANLVKHWQNWKHSYINPSYQKYLPTESE